jgi:hypothetical protein
MKRIISLLVLLALTTGTFACTGNESPAAVEKATAAVEKKVEVIYFHFTRRCMTCNNVEKVSKEAVLNQFAAQVKSGEVTFQSVNLDEKEGEAIGAKHKIEVQALVVICGEKQIDLTDKGFLWANNSPEKLKAEIKKAVEGLMK